MVPVVNLVLADQLVDLIVATGGYRVLRQFPHLWTESSPDPSWKRAVIIDTETTGLDTATCKIIEIALLEVYFGPTDTLIAAGRSYSGLQDPGESLSEEVKRVTGLTDDDFKGQQIDWQRVTEILTDANVIIAHNAGFDRPIVERYVPIAAARAWACSSEELPWRDIGCPSRALECIAWFLGYFYTAHRAGSDVEALAGILQHTRNPIEGSFFQQLIASARQSRPRVRAVGSPFEMKDALKARGYRWDAEKKVWYKDISAEALEGEFAWLKSDAKSAPTSEVISATKRYKAGN